MPVDDVALRPCTLHDAEALSLVACATFLDAYAGFIDGQALLAFCRRHHTPAAYATYLAQPSTRACLAEMAPGAAPVGYTLLTTPDLPLPDLAPTDIELKRIYLLTRLHRTGIGQCLMDRAIDTATRLGSRRILLGVHRDNTRALRFYSKNAFEPVGVRTFQVGDRAYDDLILAKTL